MNCLVVITHPLSESLCSHLGSRITAILEAQGHQVVVENLYENGFEPALTVAERQSYYGPRFDNCAVSENAERLQNAEALVLVFPTWWFSFPAMLKGWFDRVWGPEVAFDHSDNFGPIKPRLTKLKQTLVVTTLGAPWWIDRLLIRQPLKRVIKFALLGACARESRLSYLSLYKSENLDESRLNRFIGKIEEVLQGWRK